MAKETDHAGSGLDKPPPKTIAEKIGDAQAREGALERVGELWLNSNPAAARQWINQSALPDETKRRLLEAKPE